jgi:acetyltransferase-like isoleucine patch superfamily enzyme
VGELVLKYIVHPNVELGKGSEIGAWAVVGEPPRGQKPGNIATRIGAGAVIRSHTVIYAGNIIGRNFQTGHFVMIRESNEIGDNVSIGTGTVVEHHVIIGNDVRIHSSAFIPEFCILEEGSWIGPNVVLTNAKYPNQPDTKKNLKGVSIGRHAIIGANVTILPGIVIGAGALVGAGSLVTTDLPEKAVYYGNPAVQRRILD